MITSSRKIRKVGRGMVVRIVRGTLLGILLGMCGGVIISHLIQLMKQDTVEAFAEDTIRLDGMTVYEDAICSDVEQENAGEECSDVEQMPEDVVIRFHVRANSDSDEDIALKYQVRDAVLQSVAGELGDMESREKALVYLAQHLQEIRDVAERTIAAEGYSYKVKAYITRDEFPIREYGNLVLPAGSYQALRIDIGEARGENFWCLLYPMMCYTLDAGAVVDDTSAEELKRELTEEEFDKLFVKHNPEGEKVKIRFKLLEMFE